MIVTPCALDDLAGLGQLAVAARLGREVDDHRARPHRARPSSAVISTGAAPARDQRGGDDDVGLGDVRARAARCSLAVRVLGELLGVAAASPVAGRAERRARRTSRRATRPAPSPPGARRTPRRRAPSRRAVAIACRPATPAPSTSTRAGAMVPAAVISSGKNCGSASAASSTAL